MRVMPPMKFGDRLGITFASFRLYQNALLEMRFEQTLQRHEKCRAVVTMPVSKSAGHDFGIVNLYFYLRIAWQRRIKAIEEKIAMEAMSRRHNAIEFKLQILVFVGLGMHLIAPRLKKRASLVRQRA